MQTTRVAGRYTLDREIGRGGSGAVWLGRDDVLGRQIAVKRIGLPPGALEADVQRAQREAHLSARVIHPNVVAVYDFVEDGDLHWLVMEYVDGPNLAQIVRDRGALPPDEAARILGRVADALAAAHAVDVVHRDVKPSNVLVGSDDVVKLSDFGIARAVADAALTQTGLVTGSPAYLSPEVATGATATPASDVWSLGATMFHVLAGQPPYKAGDDPGSILGALYRIAHEEPPRLRTAGWLGPLLEMTMTRDPASRPTMAEVADYLHARNGTTSEQPVMPPIAAPEPTTPYPSSGTKAFAPAPAVATPAPRPATPATAATAAAPSARSRLVPAAVVGGVVLVLLAVLGLFLLAGGDDDPGTASDGTSQDTGGSEGSDSPDDATSDDAGPTADELEQFATSYVETASSNPSAGFQQLTADYQEQSPNYADFWGSVSNPRILQVSAEPDALRVTYRYTYLLRGEGKRTETVTLQLVEEGDRLLIAGAT